MTATGEDDVTAANGVPSRGRERVGGLDASEDDGRGGEEGGDLDHFEGGRVVWC